MFRAVAQARSDVSTMLGYMPLALVLIPQLLFYRFGLLLTSWTVVINVAALPAIGFEEYIV